MGPLELCTTPNVGYILQRKWEAEKMCQGSKYHYLGLSYFIYLQHILVAIRPGMYRGGYQSIWRAKISNLGTSPLKLCTISVWVICY